MSDRKDGLDFLRAGVADFGAVTPEADFLHGQADESDFTVSETYWFELLMPEQGLVGHIYIWTRPNLGICHSGVWISRGFAEHPLLMEHMDYRIALPMPRVAGSRIAVPSVGLTLDIVEPLRVIDVRYTPPGSETRLAFRATAVTPIAMRSNGKHFEQFMHLEGELALNGARYRIDHLGSRDRSWDKPRPEAPLLAPVMAWNSGVMDGGRLAFNLVGADDPERGAEWAGIYPLAPAATLLDGWFLRDGELRKVVRMSKRTTREPANRMRALSIHAEFEDSAGEQHEVIGRPIAGHWVLAWPNLYTWLGMTEWKLDGVRGYGDTQEYCGSDYARRFWR